MGVINMTPDSFSQDGLLSTGEDVAVRAEQLVREGADILDIGGESTRPGYEHVSVDEELARVIPAIRAVRGRVDVPLSVDTSKSAVAQAALLEGVEVVNDVSGLSDPSMAPLVAASGASLVLVDTHCVRYADDVVYAVGTNLEVLVAQAESAGVAPDCLLVDPGFGFGKHWQQNLELIRRLGELRRLGRPILVGPSRKGTIARVLRGDVDDRLEGTAALVALSIAGGADIVRVHDVAAMARVARMADRLAR
jgi:dihydropteroate synthase